MYLSLPDDSIPIAEMFERFFAEESTPARVRDAEAKGFDPALWRSLVELDAPFLRLREEDGGSGMGLFDACLMMEQAGRRLASVPLAESVVAARLLGQLGGDVAGKWLERMRDGESVVTLALSPAKEGKAQLVPGGAVAAAILMFDGEQIVIEAPADLTVPATIASSANAAFTPGKGQREVVASNADVATLWAQAMEEWKILTAAALAGLSDEALRMAAAYATEREAFGQPIGAYQAISHPLADDAIDADGARMLLWWTLRRMADGEQDAGALVAILFWWAARTATNAVAHAVHTFGGYGLSDEYDIQLYFRRAKGWANAAGDPRAQLTLAGRRLLLGEAAMLPDAGPLAISFESEDQEDALAAETRALFAGLLDPDKHMLHEQNFEAHDWDVHRAMGQAGLLFPDWPEQWGGRGAGAESTRASNAIWSEVGYAGLARGVTGMAGAIVQRFGSPELQEEVLRPFASGAKTACLGFTEPSGGSDVFAARTRAVRDGDEWVINGQKMFTSGAELASYVLLLTRTDPDVPKHKGLTLFLVPLEVPGVEIHPVHTFMDERTNATFYEDVRIPDRYRLGEVNSGVKTMSAALSMEQGGSYYFKEMREMADAVAEWARGETRDGVPAIEHPDVLARLAQVHARATISEAMNARNIWVRRAGEPDLAYGPATKVFTTAAFIDAASDLLDLAAPGSLIRGRTGLGVVEKGHRHAAATSVYGGTSEVLKSMVGERRLGLPRSRS